MFPRRFLFAHPGDLHAPPLDALVPLLERLRLAQPLRCAFLELDSSKDDGVLVERLSEHLSDSPERTIIGGFSLGARIAAMVSLHVPVAGLVGLSFPFHRHGQPQMRHGFDILRRVTVPTLLIQGTRDAHGNEAQVRGMRPLPAQVEVVWLRDANHRWRSRGSEAPTTEAHAKDAALAIQTFAQGLVSRAHV